MMWLSAFRANPVVVKTEAIESDISPISFGTTGIAVLSTKVFHRAKVSKPLHVKKTLFGVVLVVLGLAVSSGILDQNIKGIKVSGGAAFKHVKTTIDAAPAFKDSLKTSGVIVLKKIRATVDAAPTSLRISRRLVIKRVQTTIGAAPGFSRSIKTSGGIIINKVQARIEAFSWTSPRFRNTIPSLPPTVLLKRTYPITPARGSAAWLSSRRDILQGGVNITSFGFGDAVVCPQRFYEPIDEIVRESNLKIQFWETLGRLIMAISLWRLALQVYRYLSSSWKNLHSLLHWAFRHAYREPGGLDSTSEITLSRERLTGASDYCFPLDSFTETLLPDCPDYARVFWKTTEPVVGGHPFYLTLDSSVLARDPEAPILPSPSPKDDGLDVPILVAVPTVIQEEVDTEEAVDPDLLVEQPDVEPQAAPQVPEEVVDEAIQIVVEKEAAIIASSSASSQGSVLNPSAGEFIPRGLYGSIHAFPPKVTVVLRSSEIGRRRRHRTRQNKRARRDEEVVANDDAVPNWAAA